MKYISLLSIVLLTVFSGCTTHSPKDTAGSDNTPLSSLPDPKIITSFNELEAQYFRSADSLLVINFWATWCKPCVQELPYFNEVSGQLKGQKVKFIYVSLDFMNTIEKSVKPFLKKNPFNGEVILLADQDVNNWAINIDKNWDGAIPVTLLIKNDKKTARLGSFKDTKDLYSFIQSNL